MFKKLLPTYIYESIDKIPFEELEKLGIKGLIIDIDNTLTNHKNDLDDDKRAWMNEAKKRGFNICILSNTFSEKKVKNLMNEFDINGLNLAMKPLLKGYTFALNLVGLKKEEVCMIGDQIFTDIYGANRFGIMSILVKPFDKIEGIWIKIKRPLEKPVIYMHKKKKIKEINKQIKEINKKK